MLPHLANSPKGRLLAATTVENLVTLLGTAEHPDRAVEAEGVAPHSSDLALGQDLGTTSTGVAAEVAGGTAAPLAEGAQVATMEVARRS